MVFLVAIAQQLQSNVIQCVLLDSMALPVQLAMFSAQLALDSTHTNVLHAQMILRLLRVPLMTIFMHKHSVVIAEIVILIREPVNNVMMEI